MILYTCSYGSAQPARWVVRSGYQILWLALFAVLISACSDIPPAPLVVGSSITVENTLLSPIDIKINGVAVGQVMPQEKRKIQRGNLDKLEVDWSLVRPISRGIAMGDSLAGVISGDLPGDGDDISVTVDNVVGDGADAIYYFAPVFTNTTSVPMVIGVNVGTYAEQRPARAIAPGESKVYVGYYRLGSNSTIRCYDTAVAYGPLLFIERAFDRDFNLSSLASGSGATEFIFDQPPPRNRTDNPPIRRAASSTPSSLAARRGE